MINKYQACKLGVSITVAVIIAAVLTAVAFNVDGITKAVAVITGGDFSAFLYNVGWIILSIISPASFVGNVYIVKTQEHPNVLVGILLFVLVGISIFGPLFSLALWVTEFESPLRFQYGLSLIPFIIAVIGVLVYHSRFAKSVCKRINMDENNQ